MDTTIVKQDMALPLIGGATLLTFPESCPLDCGLSGGGVYFDFEFPFEFNESLLTLIQESLTGLLKAEFTTKEMVPFVAHEYFQAKGLPHRAEAVLEEQFQTVTVIEWGDALDYVVGEFEPPGAVKVTGFEIRGDVTRLYAMAGSDKKDVSRRIRESKEAEEKAKGALDQGVVTFKGGELYFLQSGATLFDQIVSLWKRVMREAGLACVQFPEGEYFIEAHRALGTSCQMRVSKGEGTSIWDPLQTHVDWGQIVVKSEEVERICNFILHLRQKISTILGLKDADDLSDAYGRSWPRFWIEVRELEQGLSAVEFSLLGSVEVIVAWLLENGRWKLQFED